MGLRFTIFCFSSIFFLGFLLDAKPKDIEEHLFIQLVHINGQDTWQLKIRIS